MQLIASLARSAARRIARAWLASRFYFLLGYSWRLAWLKADRN